MRFERVCLGLVGLLTMAAAGLAVFTSFDPTPTAAMAVGLLVLYVAQRDARS